MSNVIPAMLLAVAGRSHARELSADGKIRFEIFVCIERNVDHSEYSIGGQRNLSFLSIESEQMDRFEGVSELERRAFSVALGAILAECTSSFFAIFFSPDLTMFFSSAQVLGGLLGMAGKTTQKHRFDHANAHLFSIP